MGAHRRPTSEDASPPKHYRCLRRRRPRKRGPFPPGETCSPRRGHRLFAGAAISQKPKPPLSASYPPRANAGVPAFYRWISQKYPLIVKDVIEDPSTTVDGVEVPCDTSRPNPNGLEYHNLVRKGFFLLFFAPPFLSRSLLASRPPGRAAASGPRSSKQGVLPES